MKELSDHHLNVLVESKVFGFPVYQIGKDGYGQSLWVCGTNKYNNEPIKEWCTDEKLAAALVEKYARRSRCVSGATPREVCLNSLREEGLEI